MLTFELFCVPLGRPLPRASRPLIFLYLPNFPFLFEGRQVRPYPDATHQQIVSLFVQTLVYQATNTCQYFDPQKRTNSCKFWS
jgi:hypothetical protein